MDRGPPRKPNASRSASVPRTGVYSVLGAGRSGRGRGEVGLPSLRTKSAADSAYLVLVGQTVLRESQHMEMVGRAKEIVAGCAPVSDILMHNDSVTHDTGTHRQPQWTQGGQRQWGGEGVHGQRLGECSYPSVSQVSMGSEDQGQQCKQRSEGR